MRGYLRRPTGSEPEPGHSFRCSEQIWNKALARSKRDKVTMSYVIKMLVMGYGNNVLNLPKVVLSYGNSESADQ